VINAIRKVSIAAIRFNVNHFAPFHSNVGIFSTPIIPTTGKRNPSNKVGGAIQSVNTPNPFGSGSMAMNIKEMMMSNAESAKHQVLFAENILVDFPHNAT
jgi:hypothetical protein